MRLGDLPFLRRSASEPSSTELSPLQRRSLNWSRRLSHAMDRQWGFGPWRFGLESLVDLIPIVGDVFSAIASVYQLWVAFQLKLSRGNLLRMLLNDGVDLGVGLVPFVGDFFDTIFKVHQRNQRIIDRHVERKGFGDT